MYEAPDRYKRMTSARLPGGESAGVAAREAESESSSPLRDVQLLSRAQLAPFFAAANVVAALILVANLWDDVSANWLFPWAGAVGIVNFALMQLARHQAITCVGVMLRSSAASARALSVSRLGQSGLVFRNESMSAKLAPLFLSSM